MPHHSKSNSRGAVACELKDAAEIGAQILREGGSAADATIATVLAVGTLASYHSGIGGGGFALVREPGGEYLSMDFRSAAPAAASPKLFVGVPTASSIGGLSVAVPGELRGLECLHSKFGKLPWKRLFEPSIKLAREGFPITEDLITLIRSKAMPNPNDDIKQSWLFKHPQLSTLLLKDGKLLPVGTIIRRPKFAETLEVIAERGADVFYEGTLAEGIVKAIQDDGGVMTLEDMRNFKVRFSKPLSIDYKGKFKVTSVPAPASGSVVLLALSIHSNFEEIGGPGSVLDNHRMIESLKFAFAHRTLLGDPEFIPGLDAAQDMFINPTHATQFYDKISDNQTYPSEYYNTNGLVAKADNGTSHITVGDSDGLVITLTTTITLYWGSRIVVPSSGIVLNDSMEDFSVEGQPNFFGYLPTPANYIEGNKRPLSSQSPFIIEDSQGRFRYAGGAAGGSRIVSANIQQARNVMDYNMGPREALRLPRLHDQLAPDETHLEESFDKTTAEALKALGHNVQRIPKAASVGCGISFDPETDVWMASGEPRNVNAAGIVIY